MNDRLMKYQLKNNFINIFAILIPAGILMGVMEYITGGSNPLQNLSLNTFYANFQNVVLFYFFFTGASFYFFDFKRSISIGVTRKKFFVSMLKTSAIIVLIVSIVLTVLNFISEGSLLINSDELIRNLDSSNAFIYSNIIQNFVYFLIYSTMILAVTNLIALALHKLRIQFLFVLFASVVGIMAVFLYALDVPNISNIFKFIFFDFSLYLSNSIYIGLGINILISIGIFTLIRKMIRSLDEYVW